MAIGPRIEVKKRCSGCDYKKSESYAVQGDSGHDVYCTHPSVGKKYVGDTNWTTPAWCPADSGNAEHVPLKPANAEDSAVYQQLADNFYRDIQEDRKDAKRYRWLRKNSTGFCEFSIAVDEDGIANRGMRMEQIPEMLDAAIDAAMEGK